MKKQLFMPLLMILLLFVPVLTGCAGQGADTGSAKAGAVADILTSVSQLSESGRRIGVMTGTTGEWFAAETYPEARIDSFGEYMDAVSALKAGKVDAVITSDVAALRVSRENPDLDVLPDKLLDEPIAAAFRKEDTALLRDVNEVIAALSDDGTLQDMEARLLNSNPAIPADIPEGAGEVLRVGCTATRAPFNYMDGENRIVGYAPELARRIGYALDRRVEFVAMEFSALIAALQSGKIDIIVDLMTATEERKLSVSFSEPYYISGQMILIKRDAGIPRQTFRVEDWTGKTISIWTGTVYDNIANEKFSDSKPLYFNSSQEIIEAVRTGKADATLLDEPITRNYIAKHPELRMLYPLVTLDEYGVVFGKEYSELREGFNEFLKEIKADGTHDDMVSRWLDTADPLPMPEIKLTGENGTLRFGTAGIDAPFSYMQNGKLAGFDVEMAYRYARYMGMDLQIELMDWGGMIPAVQSGKVHFAGELISITEERKEFVDFSDPYYTGGVAMVIKADADETAAYRAEDFEGKSFAVWTGAIFGKIVEQYITNPVLLYFNTPQECIEAVKTGKADASVCDEPIARKYAAQNPDIKLLYPLITSDRYGLVFSKQNTELRDSFNVFLKEIQGNGVYDDIVLRWLDTADSPDMPEIPLTGENGKLVFGTTGIDEPFTYMKNGKLIGYDVEIAFRFARYMGMELDIRVMDFGGLLPAVQSGKIDFAGDLITITEERSQFVDFSEPYYIGGVVTIVRDDAGSASGMSSFWQGVQKSFHQNLIVENRWQMLVKGLGVTMLISVFAFILATLIGFAVCYMRMSGNNLLRGIASAYITILRGTPIVVLLMITYYIIFASVNINSTLVAIIAFGFNGGAFIGEIIRSAIITVDKGQVEAARSMGFSKIGAFLTVTFPQAVRVALPVYKSEFISMVKATAIVGYIAIIDLTKAGDIIRSRTYDAFFPLIIVALVYLAATGILVWIFDQIGRLTDKRQRRAKR